MALTRYTTIQKVRKAGGVDKQKTRKQKIGTGDGTTTVFTVRNPHIVSKDYAGSPDSSDIYVYLNESDSPESSENYSIDTETGEITFDSAPTDTYIVEVTYWHSTVSDDKIEELIDYADKYINEETYRSFYSDGDTKLQHTQYWDGNGSTRSFFFERMPLYSIQSISVDGNTSLTEDTDYYLYPSSTEAYWIRFESAPTIDNKNIAITYEYGSPLNDIVTRLSTWVAAREVVETELARRGTSGSAVNIQSKGKNTGSTNKYINLIRVLDRQIESAWNVVGKRIGIRSIN